MNTPGVGASSGLPKLGPRLEGILLAAWGSPEQVQPRGSRIARVVSAVLNPNKRCHRHQETPVSLRVSVPPTGLGSGNQQCPLPAAATGRDDHPVLPATPPARLSPRPPPGPGLGPAARGQCDRAVGVASGREGKERHREHSRRQWQSAAAMANRGPRGRAGSDGAGGRWQRRGD